MKDVIRVLVWRRGRGIYGWEFKYIGASNERWFSTPGWYRPSGRGRMYRLTIDHDYPTKPVWLGYRKAGRKWVNVEGLYEVLLVAHTDFLITNKRFKGTRGRSNARRLKTAVLLAGATESVLKNELGRVPA